MIATERKIALVEELAACGFPRLEIGSFVSPKAVPQLADTAEVLKRAKLPAGVRVQVLVPNAKGLERALEAGVGQVAWVISVSESHNRANVNRSVDESFRAFEAAWSGLGANRPKLRFGLSTCFDCPWEGRIAEAAVVACVERAIAAAPELEIGICDTTGRAAPDHVASLFARLLPKYASERVTFAYHGHDTYGLGVANAIEAYRQGVRVIDGAAGGLGGCPFAPWRRRQYRQRGPGVRLRAHGHLNRHSLRQAARCGHGDGGGRPRPGRWQAAFGAAAAGPVGFCCCKSWPAGLRGGGREPTWVRTLTAASREEIPTCRSAARLMNR